MFQDYWNASSSDEHHGSEWVIRTSGEASPVAAARYLCGMNSDNHQHHPVCIPNRAILVIIACINPSRNTWIIYVSWNKDTILDIVRQWWECFDIGNLVLEDIAKGVMSDVIHSPCRIPGTIQFFDATFRLELTEDLTTHCFQHQASSLPCSSNEHVRMLLCVCDECPIDDLKALRGHVSFAVVARHRRSVGKATSRWYLYTELIADDVNDDKVFHATAKELFPHCASHLVEIDRALTGPELQPLKVAFVLRSDTREKGTVTIIDGCEEISLKEV